MSGYWTHGGYLNWDTGYGFKRWHAGRTWALAQQGLLAIAVSPRFHNAPGDRRRGRSTCSTAGSTSTSGSRARRADAKGIAPSNLYDVNVSPLGPSIREMFAARMQANAARAVALGLGSMGAAEPPPLYSFDGDIGRLTITTPRYSTAVLPVNQNAFPYGGMELCRLYDGNQRVVSNVGGRPWASFGVLVRDRHAKEIATSQRPPGAAALRPPLALVSSPRGPRAAAEPYPTRPYAGPFETLVAHGRTEAREVLVDTTHTLLRQPRRDTVGHRPPHTRALHGRRAVPVLGQGARVEAVMRGGRRVTLAQLKAKRRAVSLRDVVYFYLAGEDTRLCRGADR